MCIFVVCVCIYVYTLHTLQIHYTNHILCTFLSSINIYIFFSDHDSYQRAIDVQVEERRRQKEKEEAVRQIMEQKEELRVAKQWELENLRDTQLQRQKVVQKLVLQ